MTIEQAKAEIIKRYKYLYENAEFFLAPFVLEETQEAFQKRVEQYNSDSLYPTIYMEIEPIFYEVIEEFLFSEDPMEKTILYLLSEDLKTDENHMSLVNEGIKLIEKKNRNQKYFKEVLDINNLLHKYRRYLEEQSGDLENKKNKLRILDEYFRLYRYQNNGKVYKSGKELSIEDYPSVSVALDIRKPSRSKNDTGLESNKFIEAVVNALRYEYNRSIFTEEEKAEVYMCYHDELPYEIYKTCELEEEYIPTMIESRLQRPENTEPCNELFRIDENEIFVNPNDKLYRYYQLCPHCGYIVNIPKEILSEGIKQRIEERCQKDPNLFRKYYLYSELFALDRKTNEGQKKVLK